MKKTTKRFGTLLLIGIVAVLLITNACKKDKDTTEKPPSLPPLSGFVMSFSDFSNPADTSELRSAASYNNWGFAYLTVSSWNLALSAALAVPAASFAEAFNHQPVYHADAGNWTWSYNVTVGQIIYSAELTGKLVSDSASWEMRISMSGGYTGFLWYSGKSAVSQTGGYWILKESPSSPNDMIRIDWHKQADGTSDIRYTNIKPGAAENGGYIFYGTTLAELNRFYHIYSKTLDNLQEIEWSSTLRNGHIKDAHHYTDTNWHCWGTTLQDIVCP